MFLSLSILLLAACSSPIFLYLLRRWNSYRTFRAAALRHGCQRPPKYRSRDPIFGYDLVEARKEAVQRGRQMKLVMEEFDRYGKTWEEETFDTKVINTMEVRNIQEIAALSFHDYKKPDRSIFNPFLGHGIMSQDGPEWKHSRDLIKPIFSRAELSDLDIFSRHFERFLESIPRDGTTIDLLPPLQKMFLDNSTEFLFGESIDSQLPGDPNGSAEFLQAFESALLQAGNRRLAGKLGRLKYLFDRSWQEQYGKVHAYIDSHVKRALEETSFNEKSDSSKDVKGGRYILLNEMAKQIRDPISLRFQVLNVFLPARDFPGILVSNALFHLARNPEIWTELHEKSLALEDQPLTFELLKSQSCQLFKWVLNETSRLQGPNGKSLRTAIRDTILPVGGGPDGKAPVFVEKGTVVGASVTGLHHDKDIWGDDVWKFNPYRFANKRYQWEFLPFFGGPRICPAQQQVLTQALYLLVRMAREFVRIENRDPVEEYVEMVRMSTQSRNGVKVALFTSNP
ncbi:Cytochrome P450 family protein [Rutstroemia sp. NJR-2017a BBW]|nr:Cytochrome P450 family protein [Rutstroemia sp. NJR-2017a BBW]